MAIMIVDTFKLEPAFDQPRQVAYWPRANVQLWHCQSATNYYR